MNYEQIMFQYEARRNSLEPKTDKLTKTLGKYSYMMINRIIYALPLAFELNYVQAGSESKGIQHADPVTSSRGT
jgi:hypothetical protein